VKALVIGSPVSHSLSPAIFKFISAHQGKMLEYSALEVKPDDHKKFLANMRTHADWVGSNVTLPLKECMLTSVDVLSPAASMMGALNVIHHVNQQIHGHNTDVIGIEKTFEKNHFNVNGAVCLLYGAGGSARAAAFVLGKLKAQVVYIYNRGARGKELAAHFSGFYPETKFVAITELKEINTERIKLVINTTPLGMQGQESGSDYFRSLEHLSFSKDALAFDLIYIPELTDFLKTAKKWGLKTVGGLGMLIDQALASWEIWIGPLKNADELHHKLKAYLTGLLKLKFDPSPIFLTGLMGAGKTTIGEELAKLANKDFLDTDKVIEERAALSIPEIFASLGEEGFRKEESLALQSVAARKNAVISLGGGSLKLQQNCDLIQSS
jgi:shikimate dehydrogenase